MQLFKTGRNVTLAVKNAQRLRTIIATFGRHGFDEVLLRMGLTKFAPFSKKDEVETLTVPERLRMSFESLGPTFVKFGQLLANRPDMLPQEFVDEFLKLQDNVAAVKFDQMRAVIESELGGKISDHFSDFNETPIACASIAQVYEARLKTGERIVVKVQRPDIEKTIKNDIAILTFLAGLLEQYVPETKIISPIKFVEEFFTVLIYELDFMVEANSTQRMAENMKTQSRIIVPKVYRSFSTHRILTLEKIDGIKITDVEKLKSAGINPSELVDAGVRAFYHMVMHDGLFHGDLHGGNLLAMKDAQTGEAKVCLLDFGIVGRLSTSARASFSRMVLSLVTEDYETLCYEYADLGAVGSGVDFDSFQREVRNSLAPYYGLTLNDVNIGQILISSTRVAVKYNIRLPSDWMIVFKAIFSLEGLGKQLDPHFDFLAIGQDLVKTSVREKISIEKLVKDFNWVTRDLLSLIEVAPRQIRWMMKKFNSNDFAFEIKIKDLEVIRRQFEKSFRMISSSLVTTGFLIASAITMQNQTLPQWKGYPVPSIIFLAFGLWGLFLLSARRWR